MAKVVKSKKSTPVRADEATLIKKYKHIVPGSLRFSKATNKQMVTINTTGIDGKPDGQTREIATSDLFHVRHTKVVAKEIRLAKIRKNRQAKAKAAGKTVKAKKVVAVKAKPAAKVKAAKTAPAAPAAAAATANTPAAPTAAPTAAAAPTATAPVATAV